MDIKIQFEEKYTKFEPVIIPNKTITFYNQMKLSNKQKIKQKGKNNFSKNRVKDQVKIQDIESEPFYFPRPQQRSVDFKQSFIEASNDLEQKINLRVSNQSVSLNQTIKRQPIFQEQDINDNPKVYPNYSQGSLSGIEDDSKNQASYEDEKQLIQRNKRKKIVKKGRNRKVRTTITLQKLNALNTHFKQFFQHKDRGQKPPFSIRQISAILNLSYSTILHKASVFRKKSQLKPGLLLSSLTQKRKYKKSYQCEKYIEQALKIRPFYSSLSLAKYIFREFGVSYPRAIIGRHLTQMGYSFNNIKTYSLDKNGAICINLRKIYANILQPFLFSPTYLIYVDEAAFSKNLFRIKTTYSQFGFQRQKKQTQDDYVSVIIAMNCEKIIYYHIKNGFYEKSHFIEAIGQIHKSFFNCSYRSSSSFCLINDLNKIHYDHKLKDDSDDGYSISSTIAQYGIKRLFIPPGSTRLNPVELAISYVKKMLFIERDQITNCQELRLKLIKIMKSIASEPTKRFFYGFEKWFSKAKQGVPF